MKIVFSIIILTFSCSTFANRYLDSTKSHLYLKLTSYPFLIPKNESNFAFGPSVSVSGKRLEIQIGILYDIKKYTAWYHPVHSQSTLVEFHKWYLPVGIINYYFRISDKIKIFPSFGGGFLSSQNTGNSHGWIFAGMGMSYKASEKIKLSTTVHGRNSSDGFSQGAFFEIAYRLK